MPLTKEEKTAARQHLSHIIQGLISKSGSFDKNKAIRMTTHAIETENELFSQLESKQKVLPKETPPSDPPSEQS